METGRAAGMYTTGVLWGFRNREELEKTGAHRVIAHPSELVELYRN
jgi:phosphoglycolate phosphatase